jgi:hypothetical protein
LDLVRDSCTTVIYGVFHERVEYPPAPDKLPPGERLLAHLQQLRKPGKTLETAGLGTSLLGEAAAVRKPDEGSKEGKQIA